MQQKLNYALILNLSFFFFFFYCWLIYWRHTMLHIDFAFIVLYCHTMGLNCHIGQNLQALYVVYLTILAHMCQKYTGLVQLLSLLTLCRMNFCLHSQSMQRKWHLLGSTCYLWGTIKCTPRNMHKTQLVLTNRKQQVILI